MGCAGAEPGATDSAVANAGAVADRTAAAPDEPPPTIQPMPTPTALAVSPAVFDAAHAGASVGPILPEAGGWSIRLYLSAAMIAVGLLVLVVVRRRA
jgi:hypothetical protein